MKAKTIKAVLAKKHADFVKSIEDDRIREMVSKNSIITGGSIVSMLLGEKVNDFDYYFTDKETTLAVAEYFVKKYNKEHGRSDISVKMDDDGRITVYVPSQGIAGENDDEEDDFETTEIDDIGIESATLDEVKAEAEKQKSPYRPIFLSANAIALTGKVQLVIRFYGNPEDIHANYDFVHCTCCWTSRDGVLTLPAKALEAILTRELIYTGSKYPLCSIMRTKKFIKRGWQINAGQYLKMGWQLNELNLKDLKTLRDQLTGVDSAYFFAAMSALEAKQANDPNFELTGDYLFEIINRIF